MRPAVNINGALQPFKPRLAIPENTNKYYIRRASGGYNPGIKGYPMHESLDVLSNCVSYAIGRFNEIGQYGECRYLSPVNAERFIDYAGGLEISKDPQLGACAVWKGGASLDGSDGAGHVAIVEQINSDGSIITSESGYGDTRPFWITHRYKGRGNWSQKAGAYKFVGFILNPAVTELPIALKWVQIRVKSKEGARIVEVPGIMIGERWHIQLRSISDPIGAAIVAYDEKTGLPEVIL